MSVRASSTDGIREPVGPPLTTVLRRAVLDHAQREKRRVHPPLLHVGWPGAREEVFAVEAGDVLDHTLRCDVVAAMLRTARRHAPVTGAVPMLWLTRPGPLEVEDVDLAWLAAARAATGEAGVDLTLVVVNRHGWLDPRSGVRREWKRLRQR
ncbi:hypothetical protein [Nocardioides sp. YIM 152315]|uniref:hypothetical protein n=1 Tax=Nocardioides sp. YIM 152315 TaxID=3031760 RepID=UPI0023DAA08A|nr:hypothetical protein [Nocardioides sp. YIM 152315]MDF1603163.1 hypothetical protein [Nocardioides sp. YIM 152315]